MSEADKDWWLRLYRLLDVNGIHPNPVSWEPTNRYEEVPRPILIGPSVVKTVRRQPSGRNS